MIVCFTMSNKSVETYCPFGVLKAHFPPSTLEYNPLAKNIVGFPVIFPRLVPVCAIRGICNAALAKGLLNELIWSVFPGFGDPLANLRQFHLADFATSSKGVL